MSAAARHGVAPMLARWAGATIAGLALGCLLTRVLPADTIAGQPVIPLWLLAPFVVLLASIALVPLLGPRFWHRHYPEFALLLGGVTTGYYLGGFASVAHGPGLLYGHEQM